MSNYYRRLHIKFQVTSLIVHSKKNNDYPFPNPMMHVMYSLKSGNNIQYAEQV